MVRRTESMSALDKIKKLTEQPNSLDEEDIKKFKKDFEEFEKEYDTTWLLPEEFSDVSVKLSEPKLCQVNEDGEWEECKDGKISLRKLATVVRQKDGRPPIEEPIETNIDHLPIDSMVESLRDKALRNAQNGTNTANVDFLNIYYGSITERQEHELLNVLYSKFSEIFTDTLEIFISWTYDYDLDESLMIGMNW